MQKVQASVLPECDPGVGDIQPCHSAGGGDDITILDPIFDQGDAALGNVVPGLRADAGLDLPQLSEERRIFTQLAVAVRMGRHEVDRLVFGDPTQFLRHVTYEAHGIVVADPLAEVVQAARVLPELSASVTDVLQLPRE